MAYDYTHALIEDATGDVKAQGIPGKTLRVAGAGQTVYACDYTAYTGGPPRFTKDPNTITNDMAAAKAEAETAIRAKLLTQYAMKKGLADAAAAHADYDFSAEVTAIDDEITALKSRYDAL